VGTVVRKDKALVYANVGVHAEVEITLAMDRDGDAAIYFGHSGPDVIMEFADVESLERLAVVAADGARRLRERISAESG